MSNILIYCNTYYQLITAIQLKLTIKKNDYVALLLSDDSLNSEVIFEKLKSMNVFDDVYFVRQNRTRGGRIGDSKRKIFEYIKHEFRMIMGYPYGKINKNVIIDEIIFYNFHSIILSLFYYLSKRNKNICCSIMEEGVFSYDFSIYQESENLKHKLRRLQGIVEPNDVVSKFYCYNPKQYSGKLTPIEIPKLSKQQELLKKILGELFELKNQKYNEKYIFFPCVLDREGGKPIGEFDLAVRIAQKVGFENLLIKVHPRDKAERYRNAGLHIDSNSSAPWEAIQFYHDFSGKVFLSTMSGTLFSANSISDAPIRSYYLYNFCYLDENEMAKQLKIRIENVLKKSEQQFISVVKN